MESEIYTEPGINPGNRYLRLLKSYVNLKHLDYGCGTGCLARQIAHHISAYVLAHDTPAIIEQIPDDMKDREWIYYSDEFPSSSCIEWGPPYYSASLKFILHHDPWALSLVHSMMEKDGIIGVLDYDMKGISEEEFRRLFSTDKELLELKRIGFEEAKQLHTSMGLDDCLKEAEKLGMETIHQEQFPPKFYIWLGRTTKPFDYCAHRGPW
ncbi:MAG: hypothetical protein ABIH34_04565 [Nanoarchaeota archaeon]